MTIEHERDVGVDPHAPGPTNDMPGAGYWMRVNVNEAVPGIATPLSAELWRAAAPAGCLEMFQMMGLLSASEMAAIREDRALPGRPRAVRTCFFYGRCATDLDAFGPILARVPGMDATDWEAQLLGVRRDRTFPAPSRRRSALALVRIGGLFATMPRRIRLCSEKTHAWWQAAVRDVAEADLRTALDTFASAKQEMSHAIALHTFATTTESGLMQALDARLARLTAAEAGAEHTTGMAVREEVEVMQQLWAVAHDELNLEEFLDRFGFYGIEEGELSSRSYRELPADLTSMIDTYRSAPQDQHPVRRLQETAVGRRDARDRILRGAGRIHYLLLRLLMAQVTKYAGLRTLGKSLTQMSVDVARAAARRAGALLVEAGSLDDAEDIFYLTSVELDEIESGGWEARETIERRRALRDMYRSIELPLVFRGDELRELVDEQAEERISAAPTTPAQSDVITGVAASPGRVQAVARVIQDPSQADRFKPGEVIVCANTDPGWAILMSMASGLVVDIGSPMSHAAILARELGIPCVANALAGTARIPDGSTIEVDGSSGTVQILELPTAPT